MSKTHPADQTRRHHGPRPKTPPRHRRHGQQRDPLLGLHPRAAHSKYHAIFTLTRAAVSLYDVQHWPMGERRFIDGTTIEEVISSFKGFLSAWKDFGVLDDQVVVLATEATRTGVANLTPSRSSTASKPSGKTSPARRKSNPLRRTFYGVGTITSSASRIAEPAKPPPRGPHDQCPG